MEDRKARTRAGGSSFLSREIQLKLRCVCNGERKKVEKRVEGRKKKRGYFPLFFFLFFFRGKYRARYTDTACSCAKLQPAMLRSYIMHTRVYTYTGCSKTPVYRATGVTDKLQRIHATGARARSCDNGQGWWAREDGFSFVLKRRRQTSWIKTAARREFRYEKLWGRKKYRGNLF